MALLMCELMQTITVFHTCCVEAVFWYPGDIQRSAPMINPIFILDHTLILIQSMLLSFRTGAAFLPFLLNLWFWFLLVQTGVPVLVTEPLLSTNFLLLIHMLMWKFLQDKTNTRKTFINTFSSEPSAWFYSLLL